MKIPPINLIRKDFESLKEKVRLRTSKEVSDLILMQTIEGHAHNGHGEFQGKRFVDTTMNDIVFALGFDAYAIRSARQSLIDEIDEFVDRVIKGEKINRLLNKSGEPILRVPIFNDIEIDSKEVLLGLYLGGLMDDYETRKETEKIYNIQIGGGKPYLVDFLIMEKLGIDGEYLAHEDNEDKIDYYREEGLIIDYDEKNLDTFLYHSSIRFQYIRHKKGSGVSDDLAVVFGGKLYSKSVSLGIYLADAIDTLDKFSLKFREQDYDIAKKIEESKIIKINKEDVYKFISLIANPRKDYPDSSQRYFLEINEKYNITSLEAHLIFIEGGNPPEFEIAFERESNYEIYNYVKSKLSMI
ncbi:MAG: hypothetical protein H5U37_00785 [Caldisericia bacterium]|nr:hypothetical protein [Caldisericia bacterium]